MGRLEAYHGTGKLSIAKLHPLKRNPGSFERVRGVHTPPFRDYAFNSDAELFAVKVQPQSAVKHVGVFAVPLATAGAVGMDLPDAPDRDFRNGSLTDSPLDNHPKAHFCAYWADISIVQ